MQMLIDGEWVDAADGRVDEVRGKATGELIETAPHGEQKALLVAGVLSVTPFLQMSGISKRFGGTQALRSVDLAAESGEVHAIVGENGAGKSTLSRILTGAVQTDVGEIRIGGEPQAITSPLRGQQLGIRMVHQHANLVPNLSVTENVLLGGMPTTGRFGWWIDWRAAHRRVQQILERIGFQGIDCGGAFCASAQRSARSWRSPRPWR